MTLLRLWLLGFNGYLQHARPPHEGEEKGPLGGNRTLTVGTGPCACWSHGSPSSPSTAVWPGKLWGHTDVRCELVEQNQVSPEQSFLTQEWPASLL